MLNLWIYVQTQKYIRSRFPKLFFSNSKVYLKHTSFKKKSRSMNEVLKHEALCHLQTYKLQ